VDEIEEKYESGPLDILIIDKNSPSTRLALKLIIKQY
jgi:hypothetical protein